MTSSAKPLESHDPAAEVVDFSSSSASANSSSTKSSGSSSSNSRRHGAATGGGAAGGARDGKASSGNTATGEDSSWLLPAACHDRISWHYEIGAKLGSGITSTVRECIHRRTQQEYALKIMDKKEFQKIVQVEVAVMLRLNHPNIIRLHEVFESDTKVYLVLDLVRGGELFDRILDYGFYSEAEAVAVVRQVLTAVTYLHRNGVLHRDLKLENLLYSDPDDDLSLKIADFGLSRLMTATSQNLTICGTPGYVAPEVLLGKPYGPAVDMWSIGVITYILLCGFEPFFDEDQQEIHQKTIRCQFEFPSPFWDNVSSDAKDFISRLLKRRGSKRLTPSEALNHPWITRTKTGWKHLDSAFGKLRERARARGHWKQAILGTIALGRLMKTTALSPSEATPTGTDKQLPVVGESSLAQSNSGSGYDGQESDTSREAVSPPNAAATAMEERRAGVRTTNGGTPAIGGSDSGTSL